MKVQLTWRCNGFETLLFIQHLLIYWTALHCTIYIYIAIIITISFIVATAIIIIII